VDTDTTKASGDIAKAAEALGKDEQKLAKAEGTVKADNAKIADDTTKLAGALSKEGPALAKAEKQLQTDTAKQQTDMGELKKAQGNVTADKEKLQALLNADKAQPPAAGDQRPAGQDQPNTDAPAPGAKKSDTPAPDAKESPDEKAQLPPAAPPGPPAAPQSPLPKPDAPKKSLLALVPGVDILATYAITVVKDQPRQAQAGLGVTLNAAKVKSSTGAQSFGCSFGVQGLASANEGGKPYPGVQLQFGCTLTAREAPGRK
jgi:hypothetical protein